MKHRPLKHFSAAVAAIVIGASLLTATPAAAAVAGSAGGTVSPVIHSVALPTVPAPTPSAQEKAPHPRVIAPDDVSALSAPVPAAIGTASISGTVTFVNRGPLAGIPVTAYTFGSDGSITTRTSVNSAADGSFSITGLPADTYSVAYDDYASSFYPSFQFYGSDQLHTYGSDIVLATGQKFDASWELKVTSGLTGTASCTTCAGAPNPASTEIVLRTYEASSDTYVFVDAMRPAADGSYGFDSLYPGSGYTVFIEDYSAGPFANYSYSPDFVLNAGEVATQNVISRRLVDRVAGIVDPVNEDVNALYFDYLRRLPNSSDVAFWGRQIQAGANPNIVASGFVTSDEYRYIRIDAAYRTILGREPEAAGRLNWLNGMKAGILTTDDIETSFYASTEYYNQHGASNTSFMKAIYTTLLGRAGTASDYAFWAKAVQANGRAWVIHQFWITPETIQKRVSNMYELYLGRVPDAGGLAAWVGVALQIGDSGLRAGLTGNDEYFIRSQYRFLTVG